MITTTRDVAREAGVTDTTVSLALQNHPRISDRTRRKVLAVAESLGYSPNLAARKLRGGRTRTKTIGLLLNDITNPFYSLMARAAEECAAKRGYDTIIADSQWRAEKEIAEIRGMIGSRVDGVLACFCERTRESTDMLNRFKIPFIALDTCPSDFHGAFVGNDLAEAARLAAEHLIDAGCRSLVCLTPDKETASFSSFKTLAREFGRAARARNIRFSRRQLMNAGLTIEEGAAAFDRVLAANPGTDGVFCANTLCALGFMEAADARGVRIPKRIAVMGVDDLDICRLSRISLTAIRQPYEQLAQIAADVLINGIEQKTPLTARMTLKPELIARRSTRRPDAANAKRG